MIGAKSNIKNPLGLAVRLIRLDEVSPTYAFLYDPEYLRHSLLAVLTGKAEFMSGTNSFYAGVSEIHYLGEDCLIRSGSPDSVKFYLVQFADFYATAVIYNVIADTVLPLLIGQGFPILADGDAYKVLKKLIQLLHKHQHGDRSPSSVTICELTFNLFFSCLGELKQIPSAQGTKQLRRKEFIAMRFYKLIERNCTKHHDVTYYAGLLCMSKGNLTKVIKEVTGRPPKLLIEEMLISTSKRMLDTTEDNIYSIADETGFKSSSAFISFFKSRTGKSPNEYRNRNKR